VLLAGGLILIEGVAYLNYRAGVDPDLAWCGGDAECAHLTSVAKELGAAQSDSTSDSTPTLIDFVDNTVKSLEKARSSGEEHVLLFYGVTKGHAEYGDAKRGIVLPRGGPATEIQHLNGDTRSNFTSWTRRYSDAIARAWMAGSGIVLYQHFPKSRLYFHGTIKYDPGIVLVYGPVLDAHLIYAGRKQQ
jgi:hypothetical protein